MAEIDAAEAHDAPDQRGDPATRHRRLPRGHRAKSWRPHNLGVALLQPLKLAGSAGYYCGGLNDGATIEIKGSAGWGLAESMMSGIVRVRGNAGSGVAMSG